MSAFLFGCRSTDASQIVNTSTHYDVVIIGAGMSGLAAGIRLAHFGKKVCIFERHNAVGGLNGFYSIDGRKFDVGLHAMTNFVPPGVRGTPLTKLLRQLRIDRAELDLCQQNQSKVSFLGVGELKFNNDIALFESEIVRLFPGERDGFARLLALIRSFNEVALDAKPASARDTISRYITDPVLTDMMLCPLMYYGSAQEKDMDFSQFVIMFKSIFLEGFARPLEGVRVILRVLQEKYRKNGGERRMKCGVQKIIETHGVATRLILDDGTEVSADVVLSSIGSVETDRLVVSAEASSSAQSLTPAAGKLSFVETIHVLKKEPAELNCGTDTIVFFNDSARFDYSAPDEEVDSRSGVICIPNNFDYGTGRCLSEGFLRITCLANFDRWSRLPEDSYRSRKIHWLDVMTVSASRFLPGATADDLKEQTITTDMFTPRTVRKFTGHVNGAIYGAPEKIRDGRTRLSNVFLCGTDQGFLGIVGAMLSGISMANLHVLQSVDGSARR